MGYATFLEPVTGDWSSYRQELRERIRELGRLWGPAMKTDQTIHIVDIRDRWEKKMRKTIKKIIVFTLADFRRGKRGGLSGRRRRGIGRLSLHGRRRLGLQ